jgi:hypothetical protein
MKLLKNILIVNLIVLCNCKSVSNVEYEIIGDIIPELVVSLKIKTLNFVVEPPPPIYLNDTIVGYDTLQFKINKLKRLNVIDSITSINPKLLLVFNNNLNSIYSRGLTQNLERDINLYDSLIKGFNSQKKHHNKVFVEHKSLRFKGLELTTFEKLLEKYGSRPKIWHGINDRFFGGVLSIEGMVINEENNYGLMTIYYADNDIDGFDYIVSIAKENGKWKIKEFHNKRAYLNKS